MVDTPVTRQAGRGLTGLFFGERVAGMAGIALSIPSADGVTAATSHFSLDQLGRQGFNIGEGIDRYPGPGVFPHLKLLDFIGMAFFADPAHQHADPKSVIIPLVFRAMTVDAGHP